MSRWRGDRRGVRGGGGLTAAQRADAILSQLALIGGLPSHQFRADAATLSGSNVATIPNLRGADALVVASGTLAAPAGDALFGGARSIAFTGAQRLQSNLPASSWRFLHDGTGCEVFTIRANANGSSTQAVWSTRTEFGGDVGASVLVASTQTRFLNNNGSALAFQVNSSSVPQNAALYDIFSYKEGASPEYLVQQGATTVASGSSAQAPASGDPSGPFSVGGTTANILFFTGRIAEILIFPRVLHSFERQIVREYIAARYGITAPTLAEYSETLVASYAPRHWYRGDTYTLSSGNLATLTNRGSAGGNLAMTSGTIPEPAARAMLGGRKAVALNGSAWLDSSLPASEFTFLNNAVACEVWTVYEPGVAAGANVVMSTMSGSIANGWATRSNPITGTSEFFVRNASAWVAASLAGTAGKTGTPSYHRMSLKAAGPVVWDNEHNGTLIASSSAALVNTPNSGAPPFTLRLGAYCDGTGATDAKVAEVLMFDRVLTDNERQDVREYIAAYYGIAAPPRELYLAVGDSLFAGAYILPAFTSSRAALSTSTPRHVTMEAGAVVSGSRQEWWVPGTDNYIAAVPMFRSAIAANPRAAPTLLVYLGTNDAVLDRQYLSVGSNMLAMVNGLRSELRQMRVLFCILPAEKPPLPDSDVAWQAVRQQQIALNGTNNMVAAQMPNGPYSDGLHYDAVGGAAAGAALAAVAG
jgi:hypothetical protein